MCGPALKKLPITNYQPTDEKERGYFDLGYNFCTVLALVSLVIRCGYPLEELQEEEESQSGASDQVHVYSVLLYYHTPGPSV